MSGLDVRPPDTFIQALYAEHGRVLLNYARRATGDRCFAEDVVQETLLRAWRHPESFEEGRGSARGWLLTVARNVIIDHARFRSVRPVEVAEVAGSVATTPVQRDHAQGVVDSVVLHRALGELSADHRRVLTELYFLGRSDAEAAAALGLPVGTVKSRSHYALGLLRKWFGC